jgi:hypothetical protein
MFSRVRIGRGIRVGTPSSRSEPRRSPSRARALLATVVLALTALVTVTGAAPASAQACDPNYGCLPTTTTLAAGTLPECDVSAEAAQSGTRVDATVTNVPDGTSVDLLFGGTVVASETAGSGATARAAATPGFSDIAFAFNVPSVPPGNYTLEASGPAFHAQCLAGDGFEVLAASANNGGGNGGGNGSGGGGGGIGGGSLARTGLEIGLLLAVAIGLVLVGRTVLEGSRRTRAAAAVGTPARGRHVPRDPE